jgi:hypothetical protein
MMPIEIIEKINLPDPKTVSYFCRCWSCRSLLEVKGDSLIRYKCTNQSQEDDFLIFECPVCQELNRIDPETKQVLEAFEIKGELPPRNYCEAQFFLTSFDRMLIEEWQKDKLTLEGKERNDENK